MAHWVDIPSECLDDLTAIKNMLKYDVVLLMQKYDQLLIDNNLNPEMYSPAIKFDSEGGANFVNNNVSVFIYPKLNEIGV